MEKRINDKIIEICKYLEELESILPSSFDEYTSDWKIRDICERRFEKIIEATEDLAFLIINHKELKYPESEKEIFEILQKNKIISEVLAKKLKAAKGMRNIIAHQYGEIDDELVFEAVTEQLIKDVNEFINLIEKKIISKI
jgi:uncharacterized protein YutE (UPF0331/DUF86 family)